MLLWRRASVSPAYLGWGLEKGTDTVDFRVGGAGPGSSPVPCMGLAFGADFPPGGGGFVHCAVRQAWGCRGCDVKLRQLSKGFLPLSKAENYRRVMG